MSFGPVMRLRVGEFDIELAPLTKETMADFVEPGSGIDHGMNRTSVNRFTGHHTSNTIEDELDWFEKVRKEYWGKGIASAAHKARTWYAFHKMGLHRIMSAVIQVNGGSLKALQRSGYNLVYIERNTLFADGRLHHQTNLECLNPNDPFWTQWWHGERPTKSATEARKLTLEALTWAKEHVELI